MRHRDWNCLITWGVLKVNVWHIERVSPKEHDIGFAGKSSKKKDSILGRLLQFCILFMQ